jgi:hypothetical protein
MERDEDHTHDVQNAKPLVPKLELVEVITSD